MMATAEAISERIMHERADCAAERGGEGAEEGGGGEEVVVVVSTVLSSSSIGSIEELGGRGGRPIVKGLKCESKNGDVRSRLERKRKEEKERRGEVGGHFAFKTSSSCLVSHCSCFSFLELWKYQRPHRRIVFLKPY